MAIQWGNGINEGTGYVGRLKLFSVIEHPEETGKWIAWTSLPLPPAHPSYDSQESARNACEIALSRFSDYIARYATKGL